MLIESTLSLLIFRNDCGVCICIDAMQDGTRPTSTDPLFLVTLSSVSIGSGRCFSRQWSKRLHKTRNVSGNSLL